MKTNLFINDQQCHGNKPFFFEATEQWWNFHNDFIWDYVNGPGAMAFWPSAERRDFLRMWCAT